MEKAVPESSLNTSQNKILPHEDVKDHNKKFDNTLLGKVFIKKIHIGRRSKFDWKISMDTIRKKTQAAYNSVKSLYDKFLIAQNSRLKRNWDIIMELVLGYNIVTTLYFLAYAMPGEVMKALDLLCWILFIVELLTNFITEEKSLRGRPIREFSKIIRIYLKSWLFLDIFAIIPLSFAGYPEIEYLFRMVRLLKLPGVINITDGTGISYLLTYFNFGKKDKNGKVFYSLKVKIIASFVQLFVVIVFIVYFLGCLWYWFQKTVDNYKYSSGDPDLDEGNFQEAYGLVGMPSDEVALRSSYFMLTVIATLGYGDFLPTNVYEMAFISCIMVLGVTLFAVIMGSFNSALAYYVEITSTGDSLGELNGWLDSLERIHNKISKLLRKEIVEHFKYYFENDRLKSLAKNYWECSSQADLISITQPYAIDIPEETYFEVINQLFEDFLSNFRFYFSDSEFKYNIIPHLQPRSFKKDCLILKSNCEVHEVLFVLRGQLSIGIYINGEFLVFLYYGKGRTVVGDYNAITKKPNRFDMVADSPLDCFSINSEVFHLILNNFYKADKYHIMEMASVREIKLKRILYRCLSAAGIARVAMYDISNKTYIRNKGTMGNKEEYSEELMDSVLVETVRNNEGLSSNSLEIMKNLSFIESFRNKSLKDIY